MPILSRRHRFLFLMAPGTGCTAVGKALVDGASGELFPAEDVLDEQGLQLVDHKHATLQRLLANGLLAREEAAGLFKFTTIRNPFDALVTQYVRLRTTWKERQRDPHSFVHRQRHTARRIELASRHSFEGWVERTFRLGGVRSRVVRRYRSPGHLYQGYIDGADFLMRYERLQDDFDQALRHVGIDRPIEIPQTNVTAGRHPDHRSYYTPRARAIVEKVFEPDLERFGYSF